MKHKQNNAPDGFRIGWFIPLEMVMTGAILHVYLVSGFGSAFVMFLFFMPVILLLKRYAPREILLYMPIKSAPNYEDYKNEADYDKASKEWYEYVFNLKYETRWERKLLPLESKIRNLRPSFSSMPHIVLRQIPKTLQK